jgi:hypothetical protein
MNLKEIGYKVLTGFFWLRIGSNGRLLCEHNNEHSGFINGG